MNKYMCESCKELSHDCEGSYVANGEVFVCACGGDECE